jgi:hypothetical protein
MAETVPLDAPQPSQLYVDAAAVQEAIEWFDPDDPTYDPLPVLELDGDIVLADGHTRALLAHLAGAETLAVTRDVDTADLSLPLYRECVSWCRGAGVVATPDLVGRVVSHERFLDDWVERCHASSQHE